MKPGTKPKPTSLKKLEGDIHKERWNLNEPQPEIARPTCPSFLSGQAKAEWKRIVPELETLGLISKIDRSALAAYCQTYGRWVEAEQQLKALYKLNPKQIKYLYKTTNGNLIINPLLSVANKALEQMKTYLVEFGMTPSSRVRVNSAPLKSDDPLDEVLGTRREN